MSLHIKNYKNSCVIILFLTTTRLISSAQSLDNIKDKQAFLLNGFVSTNQVYTLQPTDSSSIKTYSSYYTGCLNFNIYGVNTPLTFMYSNNQGSFTHPFNQFGMHPSYKWIKGHIGYASMSFSPYSLSGHLFLGAGIEIDPPGLFYGSAMYGRLQKAVEYDSTNTTQTAAFKRMGYGIKVGIAEDGDYIDVNFFRAYDDINSIDTTLLETSLLPEENSVMSVSFCKKILSDISFQGELANSLITTDTRTDQSEIDNAFLKPPSWFMQTKTSTISRYAIKSNITYRQDRYSLGLGYERVDPEYRTLGAYYFTNNLENATLNFSANFLDNKLSFSGNTGLQRDNLDNSKMNNTKRIVGSGNVNYVPGEKLNLNLSYSNFTSYTNVRSTFDYINETDPYENYDTLNYRQISQNTNLNSSYQLSSTKDKRQNLNLNLTWQVSNNIQGNDSTSQSNFYNASTTYVLSITPIGFSCNASLNFNHNDYEEGTTRTWGPVLGVSKVFFEKTLRTSLTSSYSNTKSTTGSTSEIYNVRLGIAYSLKKKHVFNTNALFQKRYTTNQSYNTINFTFGYVYNFNLISSKSDPQKNEKLK